jgi:hypothetical protein
MAAELSAWLAAVAVAPVAASYACVRDDGEELAVLDEPWPDAPPPGRAFYTEGIKPRSTSRSGCPKWWCASDRR